MAAAAKEIAAGLVAQEKRISQLKATLATIQEENGQLRTAARKAADLEAKLEKAEAQAKEDSERVTLAEMKANGLTADLATANAKISRLEGVVQQVKEREAAAKEVEKLLKGVA